MKTRIEQANSTQEKAGLTRGVAPVIEGLRLASTRQRIQRALGVLGMICLVILLNGCASVATSKNSDPYAYNPNTGYPAVGGLPWTGRY